MSCLDGLGPGDHVCCVVESPSHLDALAAQCFAEGAANGEKLVRCELAAFELALDEVVAGLVATVVCAYHNEHFDPPTIAEMVSLHRVTVGRVRTEPGFRMWYVSAGTWSVSGEIDASNAELFGRALTNAASQTSQLRLHAAGLRFIAVAGIRELVTLARAPAGLRLVVEESSPAFQRTWQLLELDRQLPQVELVPTSAGDPAAQTPVAGWDGAR